MIELQEHQSWIGTEFAFLYGVLRPGIFLRNVGHGQREVSLEVKIACSSRIMIQVPSTQYRREFNIYTRPRETHAGVVVGTIETAMNPRSQGTLCG